MNTDLMKRVANDVINNGPGVNRTPRQSLRTKTFVDNSTGHKMVAIEQNPNTNSEWAAKARAGQKVVQVRDTDTNKYVAVVVDGNVNVYGQNQRGQQNSGRGQQSFDRRGGDRRQTNQYRR